MDISIEDRQRAFAWWLRTGQLPVVRGEDGTELKFNPYHDPFNGQFTFAPGGRTRAQERSARANGTLSPAMVYAGATRPNQSLLPDAKPPNASTLGQPGIAAPPSRLAPASLGPRMGRGGNIRAFNDPMTLEHAFPGLQHAPGGAIITVADNLLDLTGPASAAQIEIIDNHARAIIAQIKALDPKWHFDELGPNTSVQGRANRLNTVRDQRAAMFLRVGGNPGPLQVETLRFVQQRADEAYDRGLAMLKSGRLTPRLSEREALGNYIDKEVRTSLRRHYSQLGIDAAGKGPVRVNRREDDSSGTDLTYRRPDARVADVAFDVTLTRKTPGTAQVRGFFNADFQPSRVVIVRPRQLGSGATYVISRPEAKR